MSDRSKPKAKQEIGLRRHIKNYVPVAQLDRVLASDAKGCEFEPRRVRQ